MTSLGPFIERCHAHPDRIAIIDGRGRSITYGRLLERSENLATGWQRRGLGRGDRVLLAMGLGIDLYVALAALWRLGAVVVLPEPAMGLRGVRHGGRAARPKALLTGGWLNALKLIVPELWSVGTRLRLSDEASGTFNAAETSEDDDALISFTSGSTGTPKAIARSHALLAAQNESVRELLECPGRAPIALVAFPVFVLANLALGHTSVLPSWNVRRHDKATPEQVRAQITQHDVSRLLVPPAIAEALLPVANDLAIDALFTGGGPVYPDVMRGLRDALPSARIVAVYGSTEAEPIAHIEAGDLTDDDWTGMQEGGGLLAGRPVDAVRCRIWEDEIIVTGDHVNKSYMNAADNRETKLHVEGAVWHRTGDAGRFDETGRLWLLGRLDGRAGNLYPFAVEVAARSWPGVRRAALLEIDGAAILALEGNAGNLAEWQRAAGRLGNIRVQAVARIPLDKRHASKVDYTALKRLLK